MDKFTELIEMNPAARYSADTPIDHEYIGRHLLFTHADDAFRKQNLPSMIKGSAKHGGIIGSAAAMAASVKEGLIETDILPKIKQLSLKDIGWKAARFFAKNLIGVKDTAVITKRVLKGLIDQYGDKLGNIEDLLKKQQNGDGTYTNPTPMIDVCEILGEGPLCDLYRIGDCIQGYPEEAFEDGIEWLQCLFVCE